MASNATEEHSANGLVPRGPQPSLIEVAKPYIFQQEINRCLSVAKHDEKKEDSIRIQGVFWIDTVRKALSIPVRTYDTACVYYHKFRLKHPERPFDYRVPAAALFTACKIEDTLKKSRDILCASCNMRLPASEHLSPDDPTFDAPAKALIGLERLMLEASGFDFRSRYPQKLMIKLFKGSKMNVDVSRSFITLAFNICNDMYATYAPLKQTPQGMAFACMELALRLNYRDPFPKAEDEGLEYEKWKITRAEVMETLLDLLDLYTHHKNNTAVGRDFPLDTFINIRITLNQEAATNNYPRYCYWYNDDKDDAAGSGAMALDGATSEPRAATNGTNPYSPQSPPANSSITERGKHGTVRFVIDPARAEAEKRIVDEYLALASYDEPESGELSSPSTDTI